MITRLENLVERFPKLLLTVQQELEAVQADLKQGAQQLEAEFPHTEELAELLLRKAELDEALTIREEAEVIEEVELEVEIL